MPEFDETVAYRDLSEAFAIFERVEEHIICPSVLLDVYSS